MRHEIPLPSKLLPGRECMQHKVLQRSRLTGRDGNIDKLLRLPPRSILGGLFDKEILEDVGYAEDGV